MTYSHADRAKARHLIKQTSDFVEALDEIGQGTRDFSPELAGILTNITGTSDLVRQRDALAALADRLARAHEEKLISIAPKDLTAFAEVYNPAEPPARHHVFLCDTLMDAAETPDAKVAISMPPGHAKPLWVETPVMMGDGSWKRLGDIEIGDFVITHTGRAREVIEVHSQGVMDCLKIETRTGRVVYAEPSHPFLTPGGWIAAGALKLGSTVAIVRDYHISDSTGYSIDDFALAGYMVASGIVRGRAYSRMQKITTKFRTDDPLIQADIVDIMRRKNFAPTFSAGKLYGEEIRTITGNEKFKLWLRNAGLWHASRRTMRIPEWVFRGDEARIGAFVGAIFACDGSMVPNATVRGNGTYRVMQFVVRNFDLMRDMQALLIRLGARASLKMVLYTNYNYTPTRFFKLAIPDAEDQTYLRHKLRIRGTTASRWSAPVQVDRFFDGRYAEDKVTTITPVDPREMKCLTVESDESFLADGLVVHNSTYASHLYPAWWMGNHPGRKYLQAGHTQKFAEKEFGAKVRSIVDNPNYRKVFPDVAFLSGGADNYKLTNGAAYVVKGVGQGISGYRSHHNGVDDPFASFKTAQSPTIRQTTWDWFANDFSTRLLPGGQTFIVATRWHIDDLIGRIEDLTLKGKIDPWVVINLPAICESNGEDLLGRILGEPLWPEFFTEKYLANQKAIMEELQWSCLYQGRPTLDKGNILQREWIRYFSTVPPLLSSKNLTEGDPRNSSGDPENSAGTLENSAGNQENSPQNSDFSGRNRENSPDLAQKSEVFAVRTIISVDSAETVTARADNSSIQVWRLGTDNKHYLCEVICDKFDFPTLSDMIEDAAKRWGADAILIETKGAGNQYIQARTGKAPCPIIGFKPGQDSKQFRFEGTMLHWRLGNVLLWDRGAWLGAYIDELLKFPGAKHDDNVDATSQYLQWATVNTGARRGTRKLRG